MRQSEGQLSVQTPGAGLLEVTHALADWLANITAETGLLTILIQHTSASLTIQENADPDVQAELLTFFQRIAPENGGYIHDAEGPDDMPAHIKSALTLTQISIPVSAGQMQLGTWQGVYVFEHRTRPHQRRLALHFIGD